VRGASRGGDLPAHEAREVVREGSTRPHRRVQQVFEGRLDALLTQENPTIVGYEPQQDPEFEAITRKSSAELLAWFEETRGRILARLERLSKAQWHRPGRHAEYPAYDVHFCAEYMGHHEAHHIFQMFERAATR